MLTAAQRAAGKLVSFRDGEGPTALLMFAYSFLAMTAYNVLKPATRSQAITALGADNIPYLQLGAVLLIGVMMQAYGRLAGVLPRRWLVPATQVGEAVLLLVFWGLFLTGSPWVPVAFYVLGLIMGVLLISQFWTLANDLYDPRQARRLFGFIGGGASLGGATGAGFTTLAVDAVGTTNLLLVSAALLFGCAAIVGVVVWRSEPVAGEAAEDATIHGGEALRLLRRSRHLQVIAALIGVAALGATIIDQQLNMAAASIQGAHATDTITGFLSEVTLYVSIVGLVVQMGLTTRIHRVFGLGVTMLLLPVGLGSTAVIILVTGAVWAPAAARVLDASLRYTIDKTTREILFLPLPSDIKHRVKPFVDVTVDRLGKGLGAVLLLVLIKPWGFALDWRQLSWASLVVTGGWLVLGLAARREYLASFRRSLEGRAIAAANVRIDVADAATVEALVEELASPDEESVLYAIDLLEALDKRNLITPLLLHHQSARVRARALAGLGAVRPGSRALWAAHVENMLNDEDPNVRAAAVQALAILDRTTTAATMRPYLDDDEPRVAATAAAALATSGDQHDRALANAVFTRLAAASGPVGVPARREAAAALGRVGGADVRNLLAVLVRDADTSVVREAVVAMRTGGASEPQFVPALVALLGHREVKREARRTLLAYGPALVPLLEFILHDADEPAWVRRHVPATLAGVGTQAAIDALIPALDDADGFVRFKALEAVERLHRQAPALRFDRARIEHRLTIETTRHYASLALRHDLTGPRGRAGGALLVRAIDERLGRTVDRLYRLLALIYPWQDVAAARAGIERGDARARARAVEYIDGLVSVPLRRRVLPILDPTSQDDTVRLAYTLLRTRPRAIDDALAQLIHDEDPVIAAAAILFAVDEGLGALRGDIEYVAEHRRSPGDHAGAAAQWALARHGHAAGRDGARGDWPVIALAERLREIPLFAFVSVDELCRIAAQGVLRAYAAGQRVIVRHEPADRACFLLSGSITAEPDDGADGRRALAALDVECALEGSVAPRTLKATEPVLIFEVAAQEFLSMLAESEPLAQGIFRMLLSPADEERWRRLSRTPDSAHPSGRELRTTVDRVLLLRQHPLFRHARVDDVLGLAAIVSHLNLPKGSVVSDEPGAPSLFHVVAGELAVVPAGGVPFPAGPGQTFGVADVLTGSAAGWRAVATLDSQLIQIRGHELFEWMTDHGEVLRSLLGAVVAASRTAGTGLSGETRSIPAPAGEPESSESRSDTYIST